MIIVCSSESNSQIIHVCVEHFWEFLGGYQHQKITNMVLNFLKCTFNTSKVVPKTQKFNFLKGPKTHSKAQV